MKTYAITIVLDHITKLDFVGLWFQSYNTTLHFTLYTNKTLYFILDH